LLSRLKNMEDDDSWQVFFDTYWKLIYSTAVKAGLTDAEAQDVVQETVISVSKNMPGFNYDPAVGSFKAWLLKLTRWRIADQRRLRRPESIHSGRFPKATEKTDVLERLPDPAGCDLERIWDEEWEKNLVDVAIERVKHRVDPKQYQLFDLYVLKQWSVANIAQTLNVTAARIYLAKYRISRLIKKEAEGLKARKF
jgi:RNA polymerase sigma factor (sigma-70 family)